MASEQYQGFVDLLRAGGLDPSMPIADQRTAYAMVGALLPPVEGVACEAIDANGVRAELFTPEVSRSGALLWLHGGGYCIGGLDSHRAAAATLARVVRRPVLLADYRLAPEDPHPAALDDARHAWQWLCAQHDTEALGVVGDSAGGGLALSLGISERDSSGTPPRAIAVLSPWVDLTCTAASVQERTERDAVLSAELAKSWAGAYASSTALDDPVVSPLFAELRGLCALYVQVGTEEILHDDAIRLAERSRAAGVPTELEIGDGLGHTWPVFAGAYPEAAEGMARIANWLDEQLSSS